MDEDLVATLTEAIAKAEAKTSRARAASLARPDNRRLAFRYMHALLDELDLRASRCEARLARMHKAETSQHKDSRPDEAGKEKE